tara:strand:- start:1147 stop:1434 length:288 start_codon:yes stop_codon:yes gene_type:complete
MNCSSSDDADTPDLIVTYDSDIKSIMSNNCTSCHGDPTTNSAPMSLTTFDQVKSNINNILSRINNASSPMPQAGLMTIENRNLIQQWKDDGLLEN